MAETQNLGLQLLQGNDVVDYTVLNSNYTQIDRVGKDYVTNIYTKDRWWVREWKSGRCEFGIDNMKMTNTDITFGTMWGANLYRSNDFSFGDIPISSYSKPYMNVVLSYAESTNVGPIVQIGVANNKRSPTWFMLHCRNDTIRGSQWSIFGACTLTP